MRKYKSSSNLNLHRIYGGKFKTWSRILLKLHYFYYLPHAQPPIQDTFKIFKNQHFCYYLCEYFYFSLKKKKEEKKQIKPYLLKARSNRIYVGHVTGKRAQKNFLFSISSCAVNLGQRRRHAVVRKLTMEGGSQDQNITNARLSFLAMKISLDASFQGDEHVFSFVDSDKRNKLIIPLNRLFLNQQLISLAKNF